MGFLTVYNSFYKPRENLQKQDAIVVIGHCLQDTKDPHSFKSCLKFAYWNFQSKNFNVHVGKCVDGQNSFPRSIWNMSIQSPEAASFYQKLSAK